MKIYYFNYLSITGSLFLIWIFLVIADLLGFNFALDLEIFGILAFINVIIYLFLESIKNNKEIIQIIQLRFIKKNINLEEISEDFHKTLIKRAPFLKGSVGKKISNLAAISVFLYMFIRHLVIKNHLIKIIILLFIISGMFYEVFFIASFLDLLVLSLVGIWIIFLIKFKLKAKISFINCLFFLLLSLIYLVLNKDLFAEKLANWAYLFLTIGIVQSLWEFHDELSV